MNFEEELKAFSKYCRGESKQECKLEYEDINVENFNFTGYELNDSIFVDVRFIKCNFDSVYCSRSNFSGSELENCIFINNQLQKATWDYVIARETSFYNLKAFRTDFLDIILDNCKFENCCFTKCNFTRLEEGEIKKVIFKTCSFDAVSFKACKFKDVIFEECTFKDTFFEQNHDGIRFINCNDLVDL